ncbi:hypothetical protein [Pedobacter frigoris]|uniref:Uncharacterized protein n=1 Tax=Pedobacter frigoris TaxID=2571272 RepID=A0A4U1CKY8_9SPHI|nr:hypothetical protein [Pedobacter frigoris]TKC06931.1 hypothetical protein FA047_06580 [Pedobacter frigoris]
MENTHDKNKDLKEDNTHPAPNADPGAEIETVIPNAEKTEPSTENNPEAAKPAAGSDQKTADMADHTDDTDRQDQPEITEEEKDKPEITEKDEPETSDDKSGESTTDEHGVETISP